VRAVEEEMLRSFRGFVAESAVFTGRESKSEEVGAAEEVIGEELGDGDGCSAIHTLEPMTPLERVEVN